MRRRSANSSGGFVYALIALFSTLGAPSAFAAPLSGHPRLWITAADLPRLRSWAVSTNPVYQQGLLPVVNTAVSNHDTQYFPGGVANPNYPDFGDTQGYSGLLSEEDALVLALQSLIDPNPANRIADAQRARNILMYAINQAAQGHLAGAPFRDPAFAVYNRANANGQDWPLIVDWIYNTTDAVGAPILTAADKLTIRNVFMMWGNDCVNASTTGGDHPEPIGVVNSTQLLPANQAYRMAANNYYLGHARLMTMTALSIDPADDPPLNAGHPVNQLGNSLRSYLNDALGAWLYQEFAMFADPATVQTAYGLPSSTGLGLASGGLPPEGMLYGHSFGYLFSQLLALQTAGYNDTSLSGPQIGLIGAPVWERFVTAFYGSITPAAQIPPTESYLGPVYQMDSYGDLLRLWMTPDFMEPLALLGLLEQQTGDLSRQDAERWWVINVVEGGAGHLLQRVVNGSYGRIVTILYYLFLDPTAAAPADPRPALPTAFYDVPAGRLVARSDWNAGASMFDFRCSWESINHQDADAGQFEMYRNGEWLTKESSNYDSNNNGQTSLYHNTLTLKNTCQNGTPANLQWYEAPFWDNGSQWTLGSNQGDPLAASSTGVSYSFASCLDTPLYNRPSMWTPANAALDILHASRSILWLVPDHVVVYDRATSQSTGLFKRFNLSLITHATVSGNVLNETTPNGQHLYVTSLLPASPSISVTAIPSIGEAELEPTRYLAQIEDTSDPQNVRFLHVLQGADAATPADPVALVQSDSGTPFDGAVVNDSVVLFPRDVTLPFTGTTYTVPGTTVSHYITGLTPNAGYDVTTQAVAANLQVTVAPDGTAAYADNAGVLLWPQVNAPPTNTVPAGATASPTPTPTPSPACPNVVLSPLLRMRAASFRLRHSGRAVIPKPWTAINPPSNGIRLIVDDAAGSGGGIDAVLPGGMFNGTRGWRTNAANTRWTYRDPSGAIGGITMVVIRDRSVRQPGLLSWEVIGKSGATVVLPDVNTTRTRMVFGTAAECAGLQWGGPTAPRPHCTGSAGQIRCR